MMSADWAFVCLADAPLAERMAAIRAHIERECGEQFADVLDGMGRELGLVLDPALLDAMVAKALRVAQPAIDAAVAGMHLH